MCVDLTSTVRQCEVTPGFKSFVYAILLSSVDSIPDAVAGKITTDLALVASKAFAKFPISKESGKNKINTESQGDSDSSVYLTSGEFFIGGGSAEQSSVFSTMKNGEYLFIAPDKDDKLQIIGEKDDGATFKVSQMNDESKGYKLEIQHFSKHLPYYYEGAIVE